MDLPRVCAASKIWIKFIWFQTTCSFSSSQGLTWRIMFRSSLFLDELGVLRFSCRSFIGRAQDEHKQSGDCYMKWRLSFSPNSLRGTSAQAGYQASIRGSGGHLILAWWGTFCLLDALFFQVSRPLHWQLPLLERFFSVLLSTKAAPSSAGPSENFLTRCTSRHRHRLHPAIPSGHGGRVHPSGPPHWTGTPSGRTWIYLYVSSPVQGTAPSRINFKEILIELSQVPSWRWQCGDKALSGGWEEGFWVPWHLLSVSPYLSLKFCALISLSVHGDHGPAQPPLTCSQNDRQRKPGVTDTKRRRTLWMLY